jgi:phosphatidylserine/phosphatidylglycerophosphate/cardiolipin synthase-like enzyme
LIPPYTAAGIGLQPHGIEGQALAAELNGLADLGAGPKVIARTLQLVAQEREQAQRIADRVELVWSGPEGFGAGTRDTSVVVRELFRNACDFVLVAGFAVAQGKHIFEALAERMEAHPKLVVQMFLNVGRSLHDGRPDGEIVREFVAKFCSHEWPWARRPIVFYDPRALTLGPGPRASLHAKCVVVDELHALVTSANFTEAAQERNIEAGVLVRDPTFARSLRSQFEALVDRGALRPIPGLT